MSKAILSPLQQREMTKTIEENMLKGIPNSDTVRSLAVDYGVGEAMVRNYVEIARANIIEYTSRDLPTLIDTHVYFYEQIYRFFEETNNTIGLLKSLAYKEKLLGLHREETLLEVNNTTNIELTVEQKYDFSKLSQKKQDRLEELMKKVRPHTKAHNKKIEIGK